MSNYVAESRTFWELGSVEIILTAETGFSEQNSMLQADFTFALRFDQERVSTASMETKVPVRVNKCL